MTDTISDTVKAKKRFIASAVCPQCQAFDAIVWYQEPEEYIQCIYCSFVQKKPTIDNGNV